MLRLAHFQRRCYVTCLVINQIVIPWCHNTLFLVKCAMKHTSGVNAFFFSFSFVFRFSSTGHFQTLVIATERKFKHSIHRDEELQAKSSWNLNVKNIFKLAKCFWVLLICTSNTFAVKLFSLCYFVVSMFYVWHVLLSVVPTFRNFVLHSKQTGKMSHSQITGNLTNLKTQPNKSILRQRERELDSGRVLNKASILHNAYVPEIQQKKSRIIGYYSCNLHCWP